MDQNRLFLAIAISIAILLGFQYFMPRRPPPNPQVAETTQATPSNATPAPTGNPAAPGTQPVAVPPPTESRNVPRLPIAAPKVQGSINLDGARIDDLVLRDYHVEVSDESPLVRLLEPRADPQPYYVQFGWTGDGVKVPGPDTLWKASAPELTQSQPVTLSWDNGDGQVFEIKLAVDDNYMFTVEQDVRNNGSAPVKLYPWSRIRRDYKPQTAGYYLLHEGLVGVLGGTLQEQTYDKAKSESEKANGGPSLKIGHDRRLGGDHRQILADGADPRPVHPGAGGVPAPDRERARTATRWTS